MRVRSASYAIVLGLVLATQYAGEATAAAQATPVPGLLVNTTNDGDDGSCTASHCSLREAMAAANRQGGADVIGFAIPASDPGCDSGGVCTIVVDAALPDLFDPGTRIDGFTQPGAQANTNPVGLPINAMWKIVVDGRLLSGFSAGLQVRARNTRLRGLMVQGFYDGIYVNDVDGNYVEGNALLRNRCSGVVISGGGAGSSNNFVGSATADGRNWISGNSCAGVSLGPRGADVVIGNYIGTDASGAAALANASDGVRVFAATRNDRIGGSAAGEVNIIAFNRENGVNVDGAFGAARILMTRNRIYGNRLQGITLLAGANDGIDAPLIGDVRARSVGGSVCSRCTVEVFSDSDGQGQFYEGTTAADAAGNWTLTIPTDLRGPFVTATATDAVGNTSEFSQPARLHAPTATVTATAKATRTATPTVTRTPGSCNGDCDGNGEVTVDELVRGVSIALNTAPLPVCPSFDSNGDGAVTVEELVASVGLALGQCG